MPKNHFYRIILTRILGATAGLIQGDTLTRDRWLWLKPRLPETANEERLLDVGCGTGAFTICSSLRGYNALGLTWDEADNAIACERAVIIKAKKAAFSICDVRRLDERNDLKNEFDFALCCENIEHILDDKRLIRAIYACLKPGGRLLLTSPNYHYRPITASDRGPFLTVETGWHVRRGYSKGAIIDLMADTGFIIEDISCCSGFFSQKTTWMMRQFTGHTHLLGWALTLPMRPFIPMLDALFHAFSSYPNFSICVEAYKPKEK